jgi:hypothetical protein
MDYIKKGKVTCSKDDSGKPYIELQELVRTFGFEQVMNGVQKLEEATHNTAKKTVEKQNPTPSIQQATVLKTLPYDEFIDFQLRLQASEKDLEMEREKRKHLEILLEEEKRRVREAESRAEKHYSDFTGAIRLLESKPLDKPQKTWLQKIFKL